MNNFDDDIGFSRVCEQAKCWEQIYRKAFPTFQTMVCHRQDGDHQRNGIDRSIILRNSKQLLVDEKARRRFDTGDIMLEYVSNNKTGALGWAEKDLLADYVAYAFIPSGKAYLLPVQQMQAAWIQHKSEWLVRFGIQPARNPGYSTLNCPVKTGVLFDAIRNMLFVEFAPPSSFREVAIW